VQRLRPATGRRENVDPGRPDPAFLKRIEDQNNGEFIQIAKTNLAEPLHFISGPRLLVDSDGAARIRPRLLKRLLPGPVLRQEHVCGLLRRAVERAFQKRWPQGVAMFTVALLSASMPCTALPAGGPKDATLWGSSDKLRHALMNQPGASVSETAGQSQLVTR